MLKEWSCWIRALCPFSETVCLDASCFSQGDKAVLPGNCQVSYLCIAGLISCRWELAP